MKKILEKHKAQNLSMQTIVMAVLALFILIVLIVIFSGKAQPASEFGTQCEKPPYNGQPVVVENDCPDGTFAHPALRWEDGDQKMKCCVEELI